MRNVTSYDAFAGEVDGERALVIAPQTPEDAPHAVREGLARRRIVNMGGVCPCGARMQLPNRAARRRARRAGLALHVSVAHEDDCPAVTSNLRRAVLAGGR